MFVVVLLHLVSSDHFTISDRHNGRLQLCEASALGAPCQAVGLGLGLVSPHSVAVDNAGDFCRVRLSLKRSICMYIGLKLLGGQCGIRLATMYSRSALVLLQSCHQGRCGTPLSRAQTRFLYILCRRHIVAHSQCEGYGRYYHVARLYSHTGRCATSLLRVLDQCVLQSVFLRLCRRHFCRDVLSTTTKRIHLSLQSIAIYGSFRVSTGSLAECLARKGNV